MRHKKEEYDGRNIINVYQFMEMCGLICEAKKNILISHQIMERKLLFRNHLFPEEVFAPVRLSFDRVSQESVRTGRILLVEDDYKNIIPYKNPIMKKVTPTFTEEERKAIRERLLQEMQEEETLQSDDLKPGYVKYLVKKSKRLEKVEKELSENSDAEEDILEEVTEKRNRILSLRKRQYY